MRFTGAGTRSSSSSFETFTAKGLDPVVGFRLRVTEGEGRPSRGDEPDEGSSVTREVDVMAAVHGGYVAKSTDGEVIGPVSMTLTSLIEAKSLPSSSAFVGFASALPPSNLDPLASRCATFGGLPSYRVIPHYNEADGIALSLSATLAPLSDGPVCSQWALVQFSDKHNEHVANHPPQWAAAITHLVRCESILSRTNSLWLLEVSLSQPTARIDFYQPTVFVKTPHLYVYDVLKGSLTKTDHLMLAQYLELDTGEQSLRIIDVVSGSSIGAFAARYKAVKANFEGAIRTHGAKLIEIARVPRDRWQREKIDAALEAAADPRRGR